MARTKTKVLNRRGEDRLAKAQLNATPFDVKGVLFADCYAQLCDIYTWAYGCDAVKTRVAPTRAKSSFGSLISDIALEISFAISRSTELVDINSFSEFKVSFILPEKEPPLELNVIPLDLLLKNSEVIQRKLKEQIVEVVQKFSRYTDEFTPWILLNQYTEEQKELGNYEVKPLFKG